MTITYRRALGATVATGLAAGIAVGALTSPADAASRDLWRNGTARTDGMPTRVDVGVRDGRFIYVRATAGAGHVRRVTLDAGGGLRVAENIPKRTGGKKHWAGVLVEGRRSVTVRVVEDMPHPLPDQTATITVPIPRAGAR